MRRFIAMIAVTAFVLSSCSHAVEVPPEQFEAQSQLPLRARIVRTTGGEEYKMQKFAISDSTLVILQLSQSDVRYEKSKLPISLPLKEIESMKAIDQRGPLFFFALGLFAVVLLTSVSVSLGG